MIKNIFCEIFEINSDDLQQNSSPNTISNWDSFSHIKLFSLIENQFSIKFSYDEIVELQNYYDIVEAIKKKL